MILAIDPGNEYSAYVLLENCTLRPVLHEKLSNNLLAYNRIPSMLSSDSVTDVAIEMVASYGMAVGKTVFDACVWIGRFWETLRPVAKKALIYRMDEKMNLCHDSRAKDSNIRQALIDRFASNTSNGGKGSKMSPGFFYGFASDQWAAMAVGVTYADIFYGKHSKSQAHIIAK